MKKEKYVLKLKEYLLMEEHNDLMVKFLLLNHFKPHVMNVLLVLYPNKKYLIHVLLQILQEFQSIVFNTRNKFFGKTNLKTKELILIQNKTLNGYIIKL